MSPPKPSAGPPPPSSTSALPSLPPASQTARPPPKKKAAVDAASFRSASSASSAAGSGGGTKKKAASSAKSKSASSKSKSAASKSSAAGKKGGAGSSSSAASASTAGTAAPSAASELRARQIRAVERADAAARDLGRTNAAERALREDVSVWTSTAGNVRGPTAAVPPATSTTTEGGRGGLLIDDVSAIDAALAANGLTLHDITPKAHAALLEQARRYALELLSDAQDLAVHAGRSSVPSLEPRDLLLAAELRGDGPGVPGTLPSFRDVADVADEVNRSTVLPPVPAGLYGAVALPPKGEQLTARTWDVVSAARRQAKNGAEEASGGGGPAGTVPPSAPPPSAAAGGERARPYGASRGKAIAVRLRRDGQPAGATGGDAVMADAPPGTNAVPTTTTMGGQRKRGLTEL